MSSTGVGVFCLLYYLFHTGTLFCGSWLVYENIDERAMLTSFLISIFFFCYRSIFMTHTKNSCYRVFSFLYNIFSFILLLLLSKRCNTFLNLFISLFLHLSPHPFLLFAPLSSLVPCFSRLKRFYSLLF